MYRKLKKSSNFENKQILLAVKNMIRKSENIWGHMLKCFLEFLNILETEEFHMTTKNNSEQYVSLYHCPDIGNILCN
jgi:hypothetical protein